MRYKYLNHTADLKVRAYGKTLGEAFANIAIGGFDFLIKTSKVKKKIEKNISKSAKRIESLLYDFLDELLFLLDTEGFIISGFKFIKIKEENDKKSFVLECIALGDNYKNYPVKGDIKAITYSEMKIEKTKKGYVIEVVFDI